MSLEGGARKGPDFDQVPLRGYFPDVESFDEFMKVFSLPDAEKGQVSSPAWADVRREEKAGRLSVLAQMAKNDPTAWRCLLREIEEIQWLFERIAGRVDPLADPVKLHGKQCYNSGAAKGLETLRWFLNPDTMDGMVDKLLPRA